MHKHNTDLGEYQCMHNNINPVHCNICFLFLFSGVHIVQKIEGCEWNENTGEVTGVLQYGYDGESFLEFDFQRLTWIPLKPEAVIFTENLISDRNDEKDYFTKICPDRLKWYLDVGKSSMQRTGKLID